MPENCRRSHGAEPDCRQCTGCVNWPAFECTANPNIATVSLRNNTPVKAVTTKNNPKPSSLDVKGCTPLTILGIVDTGVPPLMSARDCSNSK